MTPIMPAAEVQTIEMEMNAVSLWVGRRVLFHRATIGTSAEQSWAAINAQHLGFHLSHSGYRISHA
jgi:hypothetical protein